MYFEVLKKITTTHGARLLLGYLIRDVNDAKYLAIIRHGRLEGYVSIEDVISGRKS